MKTYTFEAGAFIDYSGAKYRHFSLAMAVAVCISTLTTRQHVIFDVGGGVVLAEVSYILSEHVKIREVYSNGISRLKYKLFP